MSDLAAELRGAASMIDGGGEVWITRAALKELLNRAAEQVERLPLTGDNVRVFPGMELWDSVGMCWADMAECDEPRVAGDESGYGLWSASSYYSSREAVPETQEPPHAH